MSDLKDIKQYYCLGIEKVRKFLLKIVNREFLIFLFFLFVSASFWLLLTLDNVYQTEFKLPFRLKNVPKDVIITSDIPTEMRVRVEDRGTVLLNYMFGRTFFPLSFDFKEYAGMGTHVRILPEELRKKISSQLNVSTKLLAVRPDTLDFFYSKGLAKKIPVRLDGQVSAGKQHYVSGVLFEPDSVTAYAPQEILDTLTAAYTKPVDLKDVTDTLTLRVGLQKLYGVKLIPASCEMAVYADMYSEKVVEVPVVGLNFPKGKVLRTFPSKVQVAFRVGLKRFRQVTSDDFFIGVDYKDLLNLPGDKLSLTVTTTSPYVGNMRPMPASVDYLIEQQATEK